MSMQSSAVLTSLASAGALLRPVDVGGNALSPVAAVADVAAAFKLLLCGPFVGDAASAAAWPPTPSTPVASMAAAGQVISFSRLFPAFPPGQSHLVALTRLASRPTGDISRRFPLWPTCSFRMRAPFKWEMVR